MMRNYFKQQQEKNCSTGITCTATFGVSFFSLGWHTACFSLCSHSKETVAKGFLRSTAKAHKNAAGILQRSYEETVSVGRFYGQKKDYISYIFALDVRGF